MFSLALYPRLAASVSSLYLQTPSSMAVHKGAQSTVETWYSQSIPSLLDDLLTTPCRLVGEPFFLLLSVLFRTPHQKHFPIFWMRYEILVPLIFPSTSWLSVLPCVAVMIDILLSNGPDQNCSTHIGL